MSIDMYNHIRDNIHKIHIDEENGIITTRRKTNGCICSSTGYLRCKLGNKICQVHQILAFVYFGEECIGKQVNHIDGNKLNNSKNNLEICTQQENIKHQFKNGLANVTPPDNKKIFDEQKAYILKHHTPYLTSGEFTSSKLAKKFGVTAGTIRRIVSEARKS